MCVTKILSLRNGAFSRVSACFECGDNDAPIMRGEAFCSGNVAFCADFGGCDEVGGEGVDVAV